MKNMLYPFKFAIAIFCLQMFASANIFAQTQDVLKIVEDKCEQCAESKATDNVDNSRSGNCRAFQVLCDLKTDENTIIFESTAQTLNASKEAFSVIAGTVTNLILPMTATSETLYKLTPQISFVDIKGNIVTEIESLTFQQYTFNNNAFRSMRGIKEIKSLKSTDQVILTSKVTIPKASETIAFIKIELVETNALTEATKVVQSYFKEIIIE